MSTAANSWIPATIHTAWGGLRNATIHTAWGGLRDATVGTWGARSCLWSKPRAGTVGMPQAKAGALQAALTQGQAIRDWRVMFGLSKSPSGGCLTEMLFRTTQDRQALEAAGAAAAAYLPLS